MLCAWSPKAPSSNDVTCCSSPNVSRAVAEPYSAYLALSDKNNNTSSFCRASGSEQ